MASDDPSKRADQAVTAPDPDEDDLDDLDGSNNSYDIRDSINAHSQ